MAIGAVLYNLAASPIVIQSNWLAISALSWILMVLSAVLALAVSYLIWYTAVQRIGSTRTSMYSYLTPIVATTIAAVWLGEPVSGSQLAGAAAIFAGLFITRLPS
jgi:drug/metabolite transporter (DMT)-like permease